MRKLAALLLIVLIVAPLFAEEMHTPPLASAASISVDESGTISVLGGEAKDLELNLSVPISSGYQVVQGADGALFDSDGNPYLRISEPAPPNPFHYSRSITVQTSGRTTDSLPASYIVPPEYSQFYTATARTQSDDPKIRALAEEITQNATEPFEKVALLAAWVNSHINYDVSLVGQENDAAWTLFNRRGVCVEYSTLFAALARSIGIPAKYVTGYAYSEKFGAWLGHAWNEAYIGKWVPVDATWFEVGALDALHIEETKQPELKKEFALTAFVSPPNAQMEWDSSGRSGAFASNIKTGSISYAKPWTGFELAAVEPELAPGGKTLVYLKVEGTDYRVVPVTLLPCSGEDSVRVENQGQYLILRPGQATIAVWEVQASDLLPKNYVYTCPLTLNSPVLENKMATIKIDPRVQPLSPYSASIEEKNVIPGAGNAVVLSLPSDRRGKNYYVITQGGIFEKRVSAAADTLPFTSARGAGTRAVYVAGEGGGFYRLDYGLGANSSISIDKLEITGGLVENSPASAKAKISAQSYPADVELVFSFGVQAKKFSGTISEPTEFEITFTPRSAGATQAKLAAKSGSATDEKNMVVDVAPAPEIPATPPVNQKSAEQPPSSAPPSTQAQQPGACPLPLAVLAIAFSAAFTRRRTHG